MRLLVWIKQSIDRVKRTFVRPPKKSLLRIYLPGSTGSVIERDDFDNECPYFIAVRRQGDKCPWQLGGNYANAADARKVLRLLRINRPGYYLAIGCAEPVIAEEDLYYEVNFTAFDELSGHGFRN